MLAISFWHQKKNDFNIIVCDVTAVFLSENMSALNIFFLENIIFYAWFH